jgi:hypothetical protein
MNKQEIVGNRFKRHHCNAKHNTCKNQEGNICNLINPFDVNCGSWDKFKVEENNMKTNKEIERKVELHTQVSIDAYDKGFLAGKQQATKELLEEVINRIDIPVDTEKYRSETDWIYAIVDACDSLVKKLKVQLSKLGEEQ